MLFYYLKRIEIYIVFKMKNVNIRMSYDTSLDIEKIVEDKVNSLTQNSMVYQETEIYGVGDLPLTYKRGWSFRANADFSIDNYYADEREDKSYYVEKGDLIIANKTATVDTFQPLDWDVYQGNIEEPVDDKYTDIIDGNF